jgi:pilus assembly protein CpaB
MARRSLLLTVAVLIALVGTSLIVLYVQGIDARASEGKEMMEVLTATETIEAGESVAEARSAGKFELTRVLRDDRVDGSLTSTASVDDAVALDTIYPGEQVIAQNFGDTGDEESLTIPDDMLAVSVELTDPARVAGFVNPGSEVAIFASGDPEVYRPDGTTRKLAPYTRLLLARVQVIGVGATSMAARTTTSDGEQTTEQIPRTILTLAVNQEDAERVIYAARNGDLAFALRTEKSEAVDNPGVTAADIMPEIFAGAR